MTTPYLLLVEDDPATLYLTRRALKKCSLAGDIVTVRDGEEALHYLLAQGAYRTRQPSHPALILLDLKLPKITGLELLKKIRGTGELASIPVVIFSASNMESDREQAHALGISNYFVKAMDSSALLDNMDEVARMFEVLAGVSR